MVGRAEVFLSTPLKCGPDTADVLNVMTKIQSAKLNALLALQSLLTASKPLIDTIPALQEAVDSLIDLILEINLNVKIQAEPSGAAQAKRDALNELGDAGFEVAGAVLSLNAPAS